jgi:hypothetical protein
MAKRNEPELVTVQLKVERCRDKYGKPACLTDKAMCGGAEINVHGLQCVLGNEVRKVLAFRAGEARAVPLVRCHVWPRLGAEDWERVP